MTADKLVMRLREMSTRLTQHRDDRDTWGAAADELEKRAAIIVTERIEARAAITAAVEEREKELIPLVCRRCASGSEPRRHVGEFAGGIWWEHLMQGLPKCPASPLHEAIHQHGPADGEPKTTNERSSNDVTPQ